ncbi:Gfo/Idh/MocA family protein [Promicromonospora sp. Populi]|uniref:Gfo/Idh/MocA family protein n=1 Tax=Promicromonospora sp. Populi TaxID=3239420 RepID=UPI0034E2218D
MTTVGLLGAGGIAGVHIAGWLKLGVEVVVHSVNGADELVARYGGQVAPSLDELLARCDVVDICTPTHTHRALVEAAAAAGCDVVCEKPFALTVEDTEAMIAACAAAGVGLFPAHVVRYFPEHAVVHDAVERGDLGTLAVQRCDRQGVMPTSPWFLDSDLSGGIVMDLMIHDIDFATWNAGPVASLRAVRSVPDRSGTVAAQVVLTHTSGSVSSIGGVWSARPVAFRTRFEVAGTGGVLRYDSATNPTTWVNGGAAAGTDGYVPTAALGESPYLTELREFLAAFRGGPQPRVTAADGLEAVRVADAARRSLGLGEVVELEGPR